MEWIHFDERRTIVNPGDKEKTIHFCVEHFLTAANESIGLHGHFYAALSGGSTPKSIYQELALSKNSQKIDWTKVSLFWSDERCVPPSDDESNYKMAMENGMAGLGIPQEQIYRMKGELEPKKSAEEYNALIRLTVPQGRFDLVMLGMGEDGHTASLFPRTEGLHAAKTDAIANYLPSKKAWRISLTYECIGRSPRPTIYVFGASKAPMVKQVFSSPYTPEELPIQKIGTPYHKALWIIDNSALSDLQDIF